MSILSPLTIRTSATAIKEGIDTMPSGVVFAQNNGLIILVNVCMEELCHEFFGAPLDNAKLFWEMLLAGEFSGDAQLAKLYAEDVIVELRGQYWHLHRAHIPYRGEEAIEITAYKVTELILLNRELEKKNVLLAKRGQQLHAYAQDVESLMVERELLDRKAAVHDELGRLLAETHALLRNECSNVAVVEGIWNRWRLSAELVLSEKGKETPEETDLLQQLRDTAQSVGIKLQTWGELPQQGEAASLLLAAGAEALTNLMRHAHGDELFIEGKRLTSGWSCELTNNGVVPEGPIVEGGGLTALRKKIESAGGAMQIEVWPQFKLLVLLLQGDESEADNA